MKKLKIEHLLILLIISVLIHGFLTAPKESKKRYEIIGVFGHDIIVYDSLTKKYYEKFFDINSGSKEWSEFVLPEHEK